MPSPFTDINISSIVQIFCQPEIVRRLEKYIMNYEDSSVSNIRFVLEDTHSSGEIKSLPLYIRHHTKKIIPECNEYMIFKTYFQKYSN